MIQMEIGGVRVDLDSAAISAIRYRGTYGDSIVNHLAGAGDGREEERLLLRMCHQMIPAADRPELPDFARLAHRDGDFLTKARRARNALLSVDERLTEGRERSQGEFDEYDLLAAMVAAKMDMRLIYELPILHLSAIIGRSAELQDPDRKVYKKMDQREMAALYGGPG